MRQIIPFKSLNVPFNLLYVLGMTQRFLNRPFSALIATLRNDKTLTYAQMADRCYYVRSAAWFNNLYNADTPWAVNPPGEDTFVGMQHLFGISGRRVQEVIAQEWYSVVKDDQVSERVRNLASRIDRLDDEDLRLVTALVDRLDDIDLGIDLTDRRPRAIKPTARRITTKSVTVSPAPLGS